MLILRTPDVSLPRPVRLLYPHFPLYAVPRTQHCFMIGATKIESQSAGPVRARSMMELLSAAYALHPAFGKAEIVETGAAFIRPFPTTYRASQRAETLSRSMGSLPPRLPSRLRHGAPGC
jgi:glycine oxidase